MSYIREIPYEDASGGLRSLYDRIMGPDGGIDNVLKVHSLRPHTMKGHMYLYKNVLHHPRNTLPGWYLETIGVYVSHLNGCDYCVQHHVEGLKRYFEAQSGTVNEIRAALERSKPEGHFQGKFLEGLRYAEKLTKAPGSISKDDVERLRNAGFEDGEILEANQVAAYFNYVNRSVMGLGVNTEGEILGRAPGTSENDEDWSHL